MYWKPDETLNFPIIKYNDEFILVFVFIFDTVLDLLYCSCGVWIVDVKWTRIPRSTLNLIGFWFNKIMHTLPLSLALAIFYKMLYLFWCEVFFFQFISFVWMLCIYCYFIIHKLWCRLNEWREQNIYLH